MKSKTRQVPDWFIAVLLALAAFLVRLPLMKVRLSALSGDEATIGIMAADILQGKFPVYYYGQSYMGALEAYIIALISVFSGVNAWTVQIGTFLSYAAFVITHYFLCLRIFGRLSAVTSVLLLVFSPLMFWELSLKALGGYSEVLFIGALSFWLWLKVCEDQNPGWRFLFGLAIGIGIWVNPIYFMYLFPMILLTLFRHSHHPDYKGWFNPLRLFLLKDLKCNVWIKIPFWVLNGIIFLYIAKQVIVFASGSLNFSLMGFDFEAPPFRWKSVKKLFLLVSVQAVLIAYFAAGWKSMLQFLKKWAGLILGIFTGQLPVLIYNFTGQEGYRILHSSGAVPAGQFAEKCRVFFLKLIPFNTWGADDFPGTPFLISLLILTVWIAGVLIYFFTECRKLFGPLPRKKEVVPASALFGFAWAVMLAMALFSSLSADRYLAPFYWVSTVFFGAFSAWLYRKTRPLFVLVIGLMAVYYGAADFRFINRYPQWPDIQGLIKVLKQEKIKAGYSTYDETYRLIFYSKGELKFLPLRGMVRIPEFREGIEKAQGKAVIFPKQDNFDWFMERNKEFLPEKLIRFEDYEIYKIKMEFTPNLSENL